METIYFDIMIGDSFYRQIEYEYLPIFELDYKDVMEHVYSKYPSLRGNKKVHVVKGKKVFRN